MDILQTIITGSLLTLTIQAAAQTSPAAGYKTISNGNPISSNVFCADPTALEYNGRLYVYGSNDSQQFVASGKKNKNTYGAIKTIVVFSTDDMVNWTFHGTIDTNKLCANWNNNPWYKGYGVSWAPSVTWRTTADGTDEFFLYFCNSSHGVGVLKAKSPIGPWTSPNKQLMIHYDTAGANPQNTNANFDPGVVIDENGVGWIAFGGLGPSGIMPNAARIVKLKPSMTKVDGSAVKIPAPYHFEANELNVIGGKFVYTYCSNWSRDQNAWNNYLKQQGINVAMPNTGTMCYMVTDNPTNPNSWVYKGSYGPHPGTSENNHSHLQKFQGTYYHIYHSGALLKAMKDAKPAGCDNSCELYRSICINKATVNESTQKISTVKLDNKGVAAIKNLDPYQQQEAETMATSGGVNYEDFTNTKSVTTINGNKNDASENLQIKMRAGAWTMVRVADFGAEGARSFTVRVRGKGKMELRTARNGKALASVSFDDKAWKEYTVSVAPTVFKGVFNYLFFSFPEADNSTYFDWWQFSSEDATGVKAVTRQRVADGQTYDLSGRKVEQVTKKKGIYIQNGKKVTIK